MANPVSQIEGRGKMGAKRTIEYAARGGVQYDLNVLELRVLEVNDTSCESMSRDLAHS